MNKKIKRILNECFEAPAPQKKNDFLNSIPMPSSTCWEFVFSQIAYIRKWIWCFSVLVFGIAFIGAAYLEKNMLWCISAFMPLLALSIITESGRSERYGMAELELSTRFSLKNVVLARLGLLGIANFILIGLLVPLAYRNSSTTILQTSIYMLCPYLLTIFLGLWATRKVRGRGSAYLCAGIAVGVSFGNVMLHSSFWFFYARHHFFWWIAAFVLLAAGTANQCLKTIKQTEELAWNLS